jgi:hypothetical protein
MIRPLGLTDDQIQSLLTAATTLPTLKRGAFLKKFVGHLRLAGTDRPPISDQAVQAAITAALEGLQSAVHAPAAGAGLP